jgi:glycosyltransferase involved in cell wall biosynthesis
MQNALQLVIFQNYYAPYRHALFEELTKQGAQVTVLYAHLGSDEGRRWIQPNSTAYRSINCRHIKINKVVLFWLPYEVWAHARAIFIISDNNPTNLAMIVWSFLLKITKRQQILWLEHIPDNSKGRLKIAYQLLCSRILSFLCDRILSFSQSTDMYIQFANLNRPAVRVFQAVPRADQTIRSERWCRLRDKDTPVRSFGYLGSNSRRKNVTGLIAVIKSVDIEDIQLHIAGFEQSSTVGCDARIIWHGYVDGDEREAFFTSIEVLVLPSLADPWGLVVNEAIDRGCLCIVTKTCGSVEIVGQISDRLIAEPTSDGLRGAIAYCASLSGAEVRRLVLKGQALLSAKYNIESAAQSIISGVTVS